MNYFNHSEVYDGIKICGQLHFFTYESINKCDNIACDNVVIRVCTLTLFFSQFLNYSTGTIILISIYYYYSQVT